MNSALFGVAVTVVLGLSGSYGLQMKGTIHKLEDRVLELEVMVEEESDPERVLEELKQDISQEESVAQNP